MFWWSKKIGCGITRLEDRIDLSAMEALLSQMLAKQLIAIHEDAQRLDEQD
jgi:hypothetical protein